MKIPNISSEIFLEQFTVWNNEQLPIAFIECNWEKMALISLTIDNGLSQSNEYIFDGIDLCNEFSQYLLTEWVAHSDGQP